MPTQHAPDGRTYDVDHNTQSTQWEPPSRKIATRQKKQAQVLRFQNPLTADDSDDSAERQAVTEVLAT